MTTGESPSVVSIAASGSTGAGALGLRLGRADVDGGDRSVVAVVLAPVARPTQPLEELPEGEVEGRVPVVRARLGADHGPSVDDGELDALTAACLAGVRLVRHDDVDALGAGGQLLDFRELLLDVRPILREHLGVPAGNHDLHVSLLRGSGAGRARPG